MPLSAAYDAGDLVRLMLSNTEECKNNSSGRTKRTLIAIELASHKGLFGFNVSSVAIDEGNHTDNEPFLVIVNYTDSEQEQIVKEICSLDIVIISCHN